MIVKINLNIFEQCKIIDEKIITQHIATTAMETCRYYFTGLFSWVGSLYLIHRESVFIFIRQSKDLH